MRSVRRRERAKEVRMGEEIHAASVARNVTNYIVIRVTMNCTNPYQYCLASFVSLNNLTYAPRIEKLLSFQYPISSALVPSSTIVTFSAAIALLASPNKAAWLKSPLMNTATVFLCTKRLALYDVHKWKRSNYASHSIRMKWTRNTQARTSDRHNLAKNWIRDLRGCDHAIWTTRLHATWWWVI